MGKIVHENVNIKTKEEKVRKVSKDHPEGYRRLATRMTPGRISAAVKVMSPAQKTGIVCMGFGSLLNIDMDTALGLLNCYLLGHYDLDSSRLVLENMVIIITKDTVHDMLGLPNEGENFLSMTSCEKDNQVLQEWKSQYDKKGFNGEEYLKRIKNTKEDSPMFRLNFLTLFINTFAESTLSGTNQINVVNKLVMLVYVYSMKFTRLKIVNRLPFIRNVTGASLEKIKKLEISVGGFGRQLPKDFENIDGDEEMVDEDEMSYELTRLYGDEEKNIEKALKNGIEKFPDSLMLNEWYEKNKELFEEVNKADNGGINSNEAGFDGHRKEGESDGGKEEKFSLVRGLVVDGDLHAVKSCRA
ncbi:unnamed protein product [Lactuca saligna]|uniref:Uncharacterized protein n=1 Tax=Lactuca saligna TaxID=75948 RepID=A0AA36EN56_LACSI|nr:unnamed protein product [Lactuca saligna]